MAICACLIVLLITGFSVYRLLESADMINPTYIENVYVNGQSFAGMTREEGEAMAAASAEEWLHKPYTFIYLDQSWPFTRASVDAAIAYENQLEYAWNLGHIGSLSTRRQQIQFFSENPVYLESVITYSEEKVQAFIDTISEAIDVEPIDAVVVPDVNQPLVISESSTGLQVNRDMLYEQIVTLIRTGDSDTAIPVDTLFPNVSSDQMSFQVISEAKTDTTFRNSESRTNVRLALSAFNSMVVQPGEICSFNEIVGPRTKERGFKKATEYAGDTTTEGYGGGVCQASTTLYQALTEAGITVLERSNHNMTVTYAEPSRDAAVEFGTKDFIFQNNTEYPVYIYTSVTKEWATVTIYGHMPEYRYALESVIVEKGIESTRKVPIEDTTGTYVYYKDDMPVLAQKGKDGCRSQGWIVSYDWETGEEVSRVQISNDNYQPGASTYWVGVHDRTTAAFADPSAMPAY